ncbi:pantoate--beta-alanine ligase [Afipia massiliensis]|uniref:Pantothenate synthetase n=2 Tax=Afipia massiliensis TaxID=211460 RepID=A0A840N0X1_9BRAD|nr:pantoate--beta-alanine ligase [Afipia massiliensis]
MGSAFMMNPQADHAEGRAWSLARTTAFVKTAPTDDHPLQTPARMTRTPIIARTLSSLHRARADLCKRNATLALVPTMGALHDGHVSLVRLAKKRARKVAVSIFVNPTQFAAHEDLGSYPRTWKEDIARLTAEGVDLVWNPDVKTMYPDGFATRVAPEGPALAGLEDQFRPHFFGGVATVVAKLFTQVRPDMALFGEKDFQQLKVVTRMARDLDLGVKVIGGAIIRERDGLAMSSRNVYLSPEERRTAPVLHRTLKATAKRMRAGDDIKAALSDGADLIRQAGFALDYLEARHAETLAPIASLNDGPVRLLVAAKIGTTRLIDNIKA